MATAGSNFEERHKSALQRAEHLLSKKLPMLSLWQEIAENFYPQRADFTLRRNIGDEFADNLTTSQPILVCRDLTSAMSAMLRPPGVTWAHMATDKDPDSLDYAGRAWLEHKTKVMFRAMMDTPAQFAKATAQADGDFVSFGQTALSIEANRATSSLLYRTWHLRDMAWCEKFDGAIGFRCRKAEYTAFDLKQMFGDRIHEKVKRLLISNNGKDAYNCIKCMHIVVPSEEYDYKSMKRRGKEFPYVSLWIDCENKWIMEETPIVTGYYIIPRWQVVSGSQYAHSPATVAALPDARLLQAMSFTLLKAGEKAVDPPMIATQDTVRSPIDIQPGGVTWVDYDYDEKLGEALRPMSIDSRGLPAGMNLTDRIAAMINSAFFLDKLQLPPMMPDTTAFEIAQRLREYIRQALPLFGPIEREYNAPLCEDTFTLLLANGAFGPLEDIPDSLQGSNIRFTFESPLLDAEDAQKVQMFTDVINMSAMAAQLDPTAAQIVDVQTAFRDALRGRQTPENWAKDEETMAEITAQNQQKQQLSEGAMLAEQVGVAAEQAGLAQQALNPEEQQ